MSRRQRLVIWGLLLGLAFLLRPPAHSWLFVNEEIAATVARQMHYGLRLYTEVGDWKGPLGYLLYAAVLTPSGGSLVALHLVGYLWYATLIGLVGALGKAIGGARAELWSAAFALAFLAYTLGPSVEVDLFMAVFTAAGVLCLVRWVQAEQGGTGLAVLGGGLLALGVAVKQPALATLVGILGGLALAAVRGSGRAGAALLPMLGGLGIGMAALLGMAAHWGTIHDYLAWNWVICPLSQHTSLSHHVALWAEMLRDTGLRVVLVTGLGIAGAVTQLRAVWRRPEPVGTMLLLWVLAGVAGVMSGSQALPYHCTELAAPVAALAGAFWAAKLEALGRRQGPWWGALVGIILVVGMLPAGRETAWRWRDRVLGPVAADPSRLQGAALAQMTGPEERVLVLTHNPGLVYWSGRRVASRYIVLEHFWVGRMWETLARRRAFLGALADPREVLRADLRAHPPAVILVPNGQAWWERELAAEGTRGELGRLVEGWEKVDKIGPYEVYRKAGPSATAVAGREP